MVGMCSRMCGIEGERIGKKDFRNGKSSESPNPPPPSPHQFLNSGPEIIALYYWFSICCKLVPVSVVEAKMFIFGSGSTEMQVRIASPESFMIYIENYLF
jgi:hypothetical protein